MKIRGLNLYGFAPLRSRRISVFVPSMLIMSCLLVVVMQGQLRAEGTMSYPDRRTLIVNNCPHIRLSNFWFENRYERNSYRFVQGMAWTNAGSQAIVAFDIVILKYDAFNDRIYGARWTVTGNDSQNWAPLERGQTGIDMIFGMTTEEVFTGIAYVRAVRFRNGTIWRADAKELLNQLHEVAPDIVTFGDVNGEIKLKSF